MRATLILFLLMTLIYAEKSDVQNSGEKTSFMSAKEFFSQELIQVSIDRHQVSITGVNDEPMQITIVNSFGQLVAQEVAMEGAMTLNMKEYASGIFFINISQGSSQKVLQFMQ